MKILLFLFLLLGVAAQAQDKLGFHLLQLASEGPADKKVHLMLEGDEAKVRSLIKDLQGTYKYNFGKYHAVYVTADKLKDLGKSKVIDKIAYSPERPQVLSDSMLRNNRILQVHQGHESLPSSYQGKDVVVGVIDTDLEFNHPDFLDDNGVTRVKYIWEQDEASTGDVPQPYNYGRQWDSTAIVNGFCTHDPVDIHGSAVAGIAAGDGSSSGGKYSGGAPQADIVFVRTNFAAAGWSQTVADGVDYIFKVADELGKPCVINISMGSAFGSHDGRDPATQYIESLLTDKNGRAVVCAAGNWGKFDPWHMRHQGFAETDTSFTWFEFNPNLGIAFYAPSGSVYIEGWMDVTDSLDFAIGADKVVGSNYSARAKSNFFSMSDYHNGILATDGNGVYNTQVLNDAGDKLADVYLWSAKVNDDGTYQINIIVDPDSTNDYLWRLESAGIGTVDVWSTTEGIMGLNDMVQEEDIPDVATFADIANYVAPDTTQQLANNWACSPRVITVGNYINREFFIGFTGDTIFEGKVFGTLYQGSSRGPSRTGLIKPDVCGPGDVTLAPGVLYKLALMQTSEPTALDAGGMHRTARGTSMASPSVAGAIALLFDKCSELSAQDVYTVLTQNTYSDSHTWNLPNNQWGFGKADALAMLASTNFTTDFNYPDTVTCSSSFSLQIEGEGVGATWNTGDAGLSLPIANSGDYSAVVINDKGCLFSTDTVYVDLDAQIEDESLVLSGDTMLCDGDSVIIDVANAFETYAWNDGSTDTLITAVQTGYYKVSLIDSNGCGKESDSVLISVYLSPVEPVISAFGDSLVSSISNTYQWYLDGAMLAGETNQFIMATDSGSYAVAITNANGCSTTSTTYLYYVNGVNDLDSYVRVYPNPTDRFIHVDAHHVKIDEIQLYDGQGRLVKDNKNVQDKTTLDLDLPPGIYYLHILSNENRTTQKIVLK